MSDILGPLAYDKQADNSLEANNPRRSVSDATAQVDKEVRDLVDDAHETALNIEK